LIKPFQHSFSTFGYPGEEDADDNSCKCRCRVFWW